MPTIYTLINWIPILVLCGLIWLAVRALRRFRPTVCMHLHHTERRWLSADGTPMICFRCHDCGYSERGHVHADPATWADMES